MITNVRARFNGEWYDLTYNAATGFYEAELPGVPSSALQPGKYYNIAVEAMNDRGNITTRDGSDMPSLRLVVKEGTPPVLTLVSPAEGILDTNAPTVVIDATDPGETASGIAPDTFILTLDGGSVSTDRSEIEGGYRASWTPEEPVSDGPHALTTYVEDQDGNSASLTLRYVVDTTPPELSIDWDALRRVVDVESIPVSGVIKDATTGIAHAEITGGAEPIEVTSDETGAFTAVLPLEIGVNDFTMTATDAAGWATSVSWRCIRLITDRTEEDAALIEALDKLARDSGFDSLTTEQRDTLNHWHKGAYNAEDLNRVEYAVDLLQELINNLIPELRAYGLAQSVAMDPILVAALLSWTWKAIRLPPDRENGLG